MIKPILVGGAGGIAWIIGMLIVFGPAQAILTDPSWQSANLDIYPP